MEKTDSRKLNPEDQFGRRKEVVRLRLQGKSNKEISEIVGLCHTHVSTIWQKYLKGGAEFDALEPNVRGRRNGEQRKLTATQEKKIKKILIDKTPDQLNLNFHLWTRDAVQSIVIQKFDIMLPLRTISDYLKRWHFTPQKPIKHADRQARKAYRRWIKSDYPDIVAKSKKENFEIHWGDEICVRSDAYEVEAFATEGRIPINRCNVNMISAVTNQGKVRFMLYREAITEKIFISFLSKLIEESRNKVFLILYNHEVFQSESVHSWLNRHKEQIDLLYLENCYLFRYVIK